MTAGEPSLGASTESVGGSGRGLVDVVVEVELVEVDVGGLVVGGAVFGGLVVAGAVFGGLVVGGAVFGGLVVAGAVVGGAVVSEVSPHGD